MKKLLKEETADYEDAIFDEDIKEKYLLTAKDVFGDIEEQIEKIQKELPKSTSEFIVGNITKKVAKNYFSGDMKNFSEEVKEFDKTLKSVLETNKSKVSFFRSKKGNAIILFINQKKFDLKTISEEVFKIYIKELLESGFIKINFKDYIKEGIPLGNTKSSIDVNKKKPIKKLKDYSTLEMKNELIELIRALIKSASIQFVNRSYLEKDDVYGCHISSDDIFRNIFNSLYKEISKFNKVLKARKKENKIITLSFNGSFNKIPDLITLFTGHYNIKKVINDTIIHELGHMLSMKNAGSINNYYELQSNFYNYCENYLSKDKIFTMKDLVKFFMKFSNTGQYYGISNFNKLKDSGKKKVIIICRKLLRYMYNGNAIKILGKNKFKIISSDKKQEYYSNYEERVENLGNIIRTFNKNVNKSFKERYKKEKSIYIILKWLLRQDYKDLYDPCIKNKIKESKLYSLIKNKITKNNNKFDLSLTIIRLAKLIFVFNPKDQKDPQKAYEDSIKNLIRIVENTDIEEHKDHDH